MTLGELVSQIDAFNRAWKVALSRHGSGSSISMALRDRKTDLQLQLLSDFPQESSLHLDTSEFDEPQYSIRLKPAAELPNGSKRMDANHIPVRVIQRFESDNTNENETRNS